jgi:hypothetical protein
MSPPPPNARYVVITPARNERENLKRVACSLIHQELLPSRWVIVDDGSDDGTAQVAAQLAAQHPWIAVVSTDRPSAHLPQGRRDGRALDGFRAGVLSLTEPAAVVVKADADTSVDPRYFRELLGRFAADPTLGIAGGMSYERRADGKGWRKVETSHPRGPLRAYRWECLDAVMELESRMGWDGLDEIKAALRGYRTATFADLTFRHHRTTGGREESRRSHYEAQGAAMWYMGYRPSYVLLRTAYRQLGDRWAAWMLWGYAGGFVRRSDRYREGEVVARLRDGQRLRHALAARPG